jgi:beta-glucanase (GH16 family)
MKNHILLKYIVLLIFASTSAQSWQKVWSDEFDYNGLPDNAKWGYDTGTGQNGWGNNELEYYTFKKTENVRVENGTLMITARKEKTGTKNYSSVRLISKNKGDWLYGRFEIAAKIPKGKGIWPAIWMLPTDWKYGGWPASGEIDIMENVGFEPNTIHFTIHAEGSDKGATATLTDPYTKFVVYSLEWYENHMDFYADTQKVFTYKNDGTGYKMWPFDKRFHILLNVAVGGNWGGQQGVDTGIFPQQMIIDYVRVFQLDTIHNSSRYEQIQSCHLSKEEQIIFKNGHLRVRLLKSEYTSLKIYSISGDIIANLTNLMKAPFIDIPINLSPGSFILQFNNRTMNYTRRIALAR